MNHRYPLCKACCVSMSPLRVPQAGQDTRSLQLLIIEPLRLEKISKVLRVQPLKHLKCAKTTQQFFVSVCKLPFFRTHFSSKTFILSAQNYTRISARQALYLCCSRARRLSCPRAGTRHRDEQLPSSPGRYRRQSQPTAQAGAQPGSTSGRGGAGEGRSRRGEGRVVPPAQGPPRGPARSAPPPPAAAERGRALIPLTRRCCWARGDGAAPRPRGSRLPRPPPPRCP